MSLKRFLSKGLLTFLLAASLLCLCVSAALGEDDSSRQQPRLVVVLVIDGLPQEQILRHRSQLGKWGFRRFFEQGAWFAEAHFGHSATFTALGHATALTGAHPNRHGLIGNEWTNRQTGSRVYCVEDSRYPVLGFEDTGTGVSPFRLKVPTVGDVLKRATGGEAKVLSISIKDRGAVLPGGKLGTAYFYTSLNGRFVTSSYYMDDYPEWWDRYYSRLPQNRWFGKTWKLLRPEKWYALSAAGGRPYQVNAAGLGTSFPHPLKEPANYYPGLIRTPFGNEYTLDFVKAAVKGERLGKNAGGHPDLLAVSFSSHDYINHTHGPESVESQDDLLRLDRTLAELFGFLDGWVGLENTIVALTADHGFAESPEFLQTQGKQVGRLDPSALAEALEGHLSKKFGPGPFVVSWFSPTFFLDYERIGQMRLVAEEVENTASEFLLASPGIRHVYTRSRLLRGELPNEALSEQIRRCWHPDLSGDLFVIQEPGWYLLGDPAANAATHGSPHAYDTHVPLMLLGHWFNAGRYSQRVDLVDLAPTLAKALSLSLPEADGRVLSEALPD